MYDWLIVGGGLHGTFAAQAITAAAPAARLAVLDDRHPLADWQRRERREIWVDDRVDRRRQKPLCHAEQLLGSEAIVHCLLVLRCCVCVNIFSWTLRKLLRAGLRASREVA